ncbi:MAG TPA: TraR/DksA family transcriptional regulator [Acidimicrobiales bacterium]|jgi:DnaK suppressor protein|nr:TraR/DksA family transcriptional regulator [Acidimicrobiales bacterium]
MTASVHVPVPEVSHLSTKLLERLRAALVDELHATAAVRAEHDARARLLTGHTDVDSLLERELAETGASRAREAMAEIENALTRMDLGTYGFCEACGVPVAPERLEAIPHARHCVRCSGPTAMIGR